METSEMRSAATTAVLTMAEIKAAIDSFEKGEDNVFAALTQIIDACEAYSLAAVPQRRAA